MKGKAAVFTKVGSPMEIREYPLPELEPGALLVKVTLANICGSDLHLWRGEAPIRTLPAILGHEMVGTVFQMGPGVSKDSMGRPLAVGDRVVYPYFYPCNKCWACLSGNRAACLNTLSPWLTSSCDEPPHFIGAYAEYYYLRPGHFVFKVPDELADEVVAPLNCALSELMYGLSKVDIAFGDTVAVQGAGGLGLYAAALAKEMGAAQVIAIDKFEERLKLARSFGADHCISLEEYPDARERVRRVRELTEGRGADVVVEVVGLPQVLVEGIDMLRAGGSYLLIGNINRGLTVEIDPGRIVLASRKLIGVATYEPWVIPRALNFLRDTREKYPFDQVVSHKFPLSEIDQAFEQADQRKVTRASIVPSL